MNIRVHSSRKPRCSPAPGRNGDKEPSCAHPGREPGPDGRQLGARALRPNSGSATSVQPSIRLPGTRPAAILWRIVRAREWPWIRPREPRFPPFARNVRPVASGPCDNTRSSIAATCRSRPDSSSVTTVRTAGPSTLPRSHQTRTTDPADQEADPAAVAGASRRPISARNSSARSTGSAGFRTCRSNPAARARDSVPWRPV
jgi:hypothetical protein